MPYITQARRDELEADPQGFPQTPGELNYVLTMICKNYMEERKIPNYATLNEIVGVLECAKLEFYRRIVADYEEEKIETNGDVY